jgi:hypothetical protein
MTRPYLEQSECLAAQLANRISAFEMRESCARAIVQDH